MHSLFLLPMLKSSSPVWNCIYLVWMNFSYVTTLTVDQEVSQVVCISDAKALIDRMGDPWDIYRHLLPRANQGDSQVDIVLATMEHYPYYPGITQVVVVISLSMKKRS